MLDCVWMNGKIDYPPIQWTINRFTVVLPKTFFTLFNVTNLVCFSIQIICCTRVSFVSNNFEKLPIELQLMNSNQNSCQTIFGKNPIASSHSNLVLVTLEIPEQTQITKPNPSKNPSLCFTRERKILSLAKMNANAINYRSSTSDSIFWTRRDPLKRFMCRAKEMTWFIWWKQFNWRFARLNSGEMVFSKHHKINRPQNVSFQKILFTFERALVLIAWTDEIFSRLLFDWMHRNHTKATPLATQWYQKSLILIIIIFDSEIRKKPKHSSVWWDLVMNCATSNAIDSIAALRFIHNNILMWCLNEIYTIHVITSYFFTPTMASIPNWKCKRKLNGLACARVKYSKLSAQQKPRSE